MSKWVVILGALLLGGCAGMYRSGASNSGSLWGGVSQHVGSATR